MPKNQSWKVVLENLGRRSRVLSTCPGALETFLIRSRPVTVHVDPFLPLSSLPPTLEKLGELDPGASLVLRHLVLDVGNSLS